MLYNYCFSLENTILRNYKNVYMNRWNFKLPMRLFMSFFISFDVSLRFIHPLGKLFKSMWDFCSKKNEFRRKILPFLDPIYHLIIEMMCFFCNQVIIALFIYLLPMRIAQIYYHMSFICKVVIKSVQFIYFSFIRITRWNSKYMRCKIEST